MAPTIATYLNGRFQLTSDIWAISTAVWYGILLGRLARQDRINVFYRFEELAKTPGQAGKVLLVVPKDANDPTAQTEWTYAEAYELTLKYARWLKEAHGVKKEEIIAVDFSNRPQFVWLWFALWSLGAIPAFLNSNLRDNAFIHCAQVSTTRLLIIDPDITDALTEEAVAAFKPDDKGRAVDTVVLDAQIEATIASLTPYRAPDSERSGPTRSSTSLLIYTSGTTGLPKAAKVAWTKPVSGAYFFPKLLGMKADDRYYTAMPLYHSSASVLGICQVLGPGATMIVSPKFSPRTQMKQITETGATIMQYIVEMCRYMTSSPATPYDKAHKLRLAFGNGMRPDVWQRFKDQFNIGTILEFYGATEGPGASFVYSNNGFLKGAIGKSGLLARIFFGANQAILKHNHETEEPYRNPKTGFCETNTSGELCYLLGPDNINEKFQGYLGNGKASGGKIIRDVFKNGRWWFVDRIGDTYRWKGENVSTAEVSEALGAHPSIQEANVYRLPNHDGRAGCAAIRLAEGSKLDDDALRTELAAHVRKRLPKYAVQLFLRLMKELEVTGTMKHQKVTLRNEGGDPTKTGEDEIYWLRPGSAKYEKFLEMDWKRIEGGDAKS